MSDEQDRFELVRLRGGVLGIRSLEYGEICHPGVGPGAEAEALYVQGLGLAARLSKASGDFTVWDVGLGGGANALAVIRAVEPFARLVRILSFDRTLEPLEFAIRHAGDLGYFTGLEGAAHELLRHHVSSFRLGAAEIHWSVDIGDFTARMDAGSEDRSRGIAPDVILFDPHSPAANPEMWTLPLFRSMARNLDPARPCALATYSRSTAVRAALLLAGWYVGVGSGTATKEETTIASNRRDDLNQPLGTRWLERARRSRAAEPWVHAPFGGRPLSEETWECLRKHPQFT